MNNEVVKELLETYRELVVQHLAHGVMISAVLHTLDASSLRKVEMILQTQAADGELQGVSAEAARLAVQLFSAVTGDDDDPGGKNKNLRIVRGGKDIS